MKLRKKLGRERENMFLQSLKTTFFELQWQVSLAREKRKIIDPPTQQGGRHATFGGTNFCVSHAASKLCSSSSNAAKFEPRTPSSVPRPLRAPRGRAKWASEKNVPLSPLPLPPSPHV